MKESILFENGKAGWNQMDLEPYELLFEDAYVLFHFISPEDSRFEWKSEVRNPDGLKILSQYGASLKTYSLISGKNLVPFFQLKGLDQGELLVHPIYTKGKNESIPAVALEYDAFK